MTMPTEKPGRRDIEDWNHFIRLDGHILSQNPALLFQQAANQPEETAPSRAANAAWEARRHHRPWLRWVNKPVARDATFFGLRCGAVRRSVFTPDGRYILTMGPAFQLWDAETGALITTLKGHPDAEVFALSGDGRRVASAVTASALPKEVRVWDLETGEVFAACNHDAGEVLSFSPDGQLIASGAPDHSIRIREAWTLREVHRLGLENRPQSCAFSPDGTRIAVTAGAWNRRYEVRLWNVRTGSLVTELEGHRGDVVDCAFSPDATLLVTASHDKTLRVWDVLTGRTLRTLTGHAWSVYACAWSPDGRRIASCGMDSTVRLWDADTGEPQGTFVTHADQVLACAFSGDSRRIVSTDRHIVLVWDATAPLVEPPPRHEGRVTGGAFSPDGVQLATAAWEGRIRLWNVATGDAAGARTANDSGCFQDCAYSPDGRRLAAASDKGFLVVWDLESGEEIARLPASEPNMGGVHCCSFSPDGRWLASGATWMVILWDAATYTGVRTLPNDMWPIKACPFSPDGTRLLDGALQVWDVATGTRLGVLGNDEPFGVNRCAYSPDGTRNVSTWKRGVRIWDAASGAERMTLQDHAGDTVGCAFTRDGRWITSTSTDGELIVRHTESGAVAARFRGGGAFGGVTASHTHVATGDAGGVVYLLELMGFGP